MTEGRPDMSQEKKNEIETELAHLSDGIRKAQDRLDHDRVHGETDLGMTEAQTKVEKPDKKSGAV
jgi:hypothetical protein